MTDNQSVMSADLLLNQSKMTKNQSHVEIEPMYLRGDKEKGEEYMKKSGFPMGMLMDLAV